MTKVFSFLIILTFIGLSSCKKDPSDSTGCATNWAAEVQAEISALSDAAAAYGTSPSTETCTAYKEAYQDYIDALEPFLECSAWTAQQKAELQEVIDDAEAEISTLCSD